LSEEQILGLDCTPQTLNNIKAQIASYVSKRDLVKHHEKILIKPNFVAPFTHATTNIDLLCLVIEVIVDMGAHPIIGESAGYEFDTKSVLDVLKIADALRKYDLEIKNLDNEVFCIREANHKIFNKLEISSIIFECDKIINMPKLKMHKVTTLSLAMKNLLGLCSKKQRQDMHILDIHEGIIAINEIIKPDLVIMDALTILMNAAVYGETVEINKVLLGQTNIGMDLYVCNYLNFPYHKVKHIHDYTKKNNISIPQYQKEKLQNGKVTIRPMPLGNLKYRIMHILDYIYKFFTKKKSIIPLLNYKYSVRPVIIKEKCSVCEKCIKVCPMDAIYLDRNKIVRINASKCSTLRCLKCAQVCPENAIKINKLKNEK